MKNQTIFRRAGFALEGLLAAWKSEKSIRMHGMTIAVAILLLFWLGPEPVWWALMALAMGMMLITELLNTAVEKLTDRLHPDIHPDIKIVKDVLAGAVFVACCIGAVVTLALLSVGLQ
jgi:undecaprenol kinase